MRMKGSQAAGKLGCVIKREWQSAACVERGSGRRTTISPLSYVCEIWKWSCILASRGQAVKKLFPERWVMGCEGSVSSEKLERFVSEREAL